MEPTSGDSDHVTPVLLAPVTEAVNCCVLEACNVAEDGETETETPGVSVTVAVADLVGSATEVAFTVTVDELVMELGAV